MQAAQTEAFLSLRGEGDLAPRRLAADQSNTSIVFGDRLIVKIFRRIEPGENPDLEIGRHLTDQAHFPRVPAIAGSLQHEALGEASATIATLHQFVESQGDGWTHATDEVRRFYDDVGQREPVTDPAPENYSALIAAEPPQVALDTIGAYLGTAEILGRRTAEMHLALASDAAKGAFVPEPFTSEDMRALSMDAVAQALAALKTLEEAGAASELLDRRERLLEQLRSAPALRADDGKDPRPW